MGNLSDYLERHPRLQGMSAREFGRLVDIGHNTANQILRGKTVPEDGTLVKISAAFPEIPLSELRKHALADTPFSLPAGAELLDLDERGLVRDVVRQLLKSSGKADRVPEEPARREAQAGNVVEMPRPQRVQKAAYKPPRDE